MRYRLEDGSEKFIRRVYANDKFGNVRRIRRIYQMYNSSINLLFNDELSTYYDKSKSNDIYGSHLIRNNILFSLSFARISYGVGNFPGGNSSRSGFYRNKVPVDIALQNHPICIEEEGSIEIPLSGTLSATSMYPTSFTLIGNDIYVQYRSGTNWSCQIFRYNFNNDTLELFTSTTGVDKSGPIIGVNGSLFKYNIFTGSGLPWYDPGYSLQIYSGGNWSYYGPLSIAAKTADFFYYNGSYYGISPLGELCRISGTIWEQISAVGVELSYLQQNSQKSLTPDGKLLIGSSYEMGTSSNPTKKLCVYTFDGANLVKLGNDLPYTNLYGSPYYGSPRLYAIALYDQISGKYIAIASANNIGRNYYFSSDTSGRDKLFIFNPVTENWDPYCVSQYAPGKLSSMDSFPEIINERIINNSSILSDTISEILRDSVPTPNGYSDVTITMSGSAAGTKS